MPGNANELFIGLLSGTSVDGVDAGLFEFGAGHSITLRSSYHQPYPPEIRDAILRLSQPGDDEIDRMGALDIALGELFGKAALALIQQENIDPKHIKAIGSHGQTIRHRPNQKYAFSLQIGDPNTIAHISGITTVADMRRMDMSAGGQGAPLAPAFHEAAFFSSEERRCIINIGGISNISILQGDNNKTIGYDTGPGNILMDSWVNTHLHRSYDESGNWAKTGRANEALLKQLMSHPYLEKSFPKSTGREDFNRAWLAQILSELAPIAPEDVQASLCEFTALSLTQSIQQHDIDAAYICGGGAHNQTLIERISVHLPKIRVSTTRELKIAPDWVEAGLFAWLAKQRLDGKSTNLTSVTGASIPTILGAIYAP
ncbi:MAG: anhydro-N-acetylmuramic acid kinase [Agarilytica sp.]